MEMTTRETPHRENLRMWVRSFYDEQKLRIAINHRIEPKEGDDVPVVQLTEEEKKVLKSVADNHKASEKALLKMIDKVGETIPIYQWLRDQDGIGPTCAGFLVGELPDPAAPALCPSCPVDEDGEVEPDKDCHACKGSGKDFTRFRTATVSSWWSYCGLAVVKAVCPSCCGIGREIRNDAKMGAPSITNEEHFEVQCPHCPALMGIDTDHAAKADILHASHWMQVDHFAEYHQHLVTVCGRCQGEGWVGAAPKQRVGRTDGKFNSWMRSKTLKVLGTSLLRANKGDGNKEARAMYDGYKNRKASQIVRCMVCDGRGTAKTPEKSSEGRVNKDAGKVIECWNCAGSGRGPWGYGPTHRNTAAMRFMVKTWLIKVFVEWCRTIGREAPLPYHEKVLGMRHSKP